MLEQTMAQLEGLPKCFVPRKNVGTFELAMGTIIRAHDVRKFPTGGHGTDEAAAETEGPRKVILRCYDREELRTNVGVQQKLRRYLDTTYHLFHDHVQTHQEVRVSVKFFIIVFEYQGKKKLREVLEDRDRLGEGEARYFFQQLVLILDYLHEKRLCCPTLSLDKLMLVDSDTENPKAKLHDVDIETGKESEWRRIDLRACGKVVYELLTGSAPLPNPSTFFSDHHNSLSQDCKDLVTRLLGPTEVDMHFIKDHTWYQIDLPERARIYNQHVGEESTMCTQTLKEMQESLNWALDPNFGHEAGYA